MLYCWVMELIKSAAKRTKFGEIAHVALNLVYAALLLVLLLGFEGQPFLAYLLVILSKWRIFAVRPRFWLANIQTNLLDTLMGLSVVTLLWQNMSNFVLQLVIVGLFALWLIVLKPSAKRFWVVVQAGVVQFTALAALFHVAYVMPVAVVVALGWLVGYVVALHIIRVFNEELEDIVLSVTWGIVIAELCWLAYYWTIAYTQLKIPQVSIVASLLGFMALIVYNRLYHNRDTKNQSDIVMPIAFSIAGIALILIFFNGFDPTAL